MSEHPRSVADYLLGGLSLEEYRERERERDAAAMRARWAQEEAEEERRRLRAPRARVAAPLRSAVEPAAHGGAINGLRNGGFRVAALLDENEAAGRVRLAAPSLAELDAPALLRLLQERLDAAADLPREQAARAEAALRAAIERHRTELDALERARGRELTLEDLPAAILRDLIEALGGGVGPVERPRLEILRQFANVPAITLLPSPLPVVNMFAESLGHLATTMSAQGILVVPFSKRLQSVWVFWLDWEKLKEQIGDVVRRTRRLIDIVRKKLEPFGKWVGHILCLEHLLEDLTNLEQLLQNAKFPDDADKLVRTVTSVVVSIIACVGRFTGNVLVDFILSFIVGIVLETLGGILGDMIKEIARTRGLDEKGLEEKRFYGDLDRRLDAATEAVKEGEKKIAGGKVRHIIGSMDPIELRLVLDILAATERGSLPCMNPTIHFFAPAEYEGKPLWRLDENAIRSIVLICKFRPDPATGIPTDIETKVEITRNVDAIYRNVETEEEIRCRAGWFTTGFGVSPDGRSLNTSEPSKC